MLSVFAQLLGFTGSKWIISRVAGVGCRRKQPHAPTPNPQPPLKIDNASSRMHESSIYIRMFSLCNEAEDIIMHLIRNHFYLGHSGRAFDVDGLSRPKENIKRPLPLISLILEGYRLAGSSASLTV